MPQFCDSCAGPIPGLYLLPVAWDVLHRQSVRPLEQLRAKVDQLEELDGIEARIAQVIRQAPAHLALSEDGAGGAEQYGSWSA